MDKLNAEREVRGRNRNLVVAATGTGKTVISAFDYRRFCKANLGQRNRLIRIAKSGYPEYFRGSAHLSGFVFFPRMGNDTFLLHSDVWIWNVSRSKGYPAAKSD